jgi:hypothetical protein
VNHRGLQRALFRMQLDPGFAARLRARERAAEASTCLGPAELDWLRAADPAAVSADREGRRRAQLLRNIAGELALSLAAAREPDWLESFPASEHFHRAVAHDLPLPLACAAHVAECASSAPRALRSLIALETALVRARRELRASASGRDFVLRLASSAWLLEVAEGTFAWASALRLALDRGARLPEANSLPATRETVLVFAGERPGASRLRPVRAERLEPATADFLRACADGLDARGSAAFCAARGIEPADFDPVVADFVADGVLVPR